LIAEIEDSEVAERGRYRHRRSIGEATAPVNLAVSSLVSSFLA
jgi:hypothetical protein